MVVKNHGSKQQKEINMEMQTNKPLHLLIWIAGVAVILLSVTGVAAIMGWIPTSMGHNNDSAPISTIDPSQANGAKEPASSYAHKAPVQIAHASPTHITCTQCGVVESTREISTKGQGGALGVIGGAVVGGLLGNQIGAGHGRDAATVVGAVGGGVAGNEIEKRANATKSYEVTVHMNDGSNRVIHEANATTWQAGDHVKIVDGVIRSN
jgi:outer membrane lipoprotein SlyB